MKEDNDFTQKDFSGGMIDANVSLAPQNTVSLLLNCEVDLEIGSAVSRLGTATIGTQLVASNSVLGLHQHVEATSANNKLFAAINVANGASGVVYDVVGGSTVITGLTPSKKTRFLTYNNATLMLNGADTERSYTNAGWITTGGAFDLANIPSSNTVNLVAEFLDRVYLAGDTANPARLYYSGISDGSTISWTVNNGYVDIEPGNGGGAITALSKVPGYILIFKERSMHRWNFNSAFPESLVQIGTPSQESVIMGGGLCAFYSNSNEGAKGFYLTNGDRPQCISRDNNRPIKKWVDAIQSANEANIAGWATDRYFCWSVGDLTVDGETFNNVVLKYNRVLNQWSMRTYPQEFKVFANSLVSGINTTVGGADDGTVYRMDKPGTYTDASTSTTRNFGCKVRQHHYTFGKNLKKSVTNSVYVRGKNLNSVRVSAFVDENLASPIGLAKNTSTNVLFAGNVSQAIEGTTVCIDVAFESSGSPVYIREIDLPSIQLSKNYV